MKQLIKDDDYYILPDGRYVFTEKYLVERGFCCGNSCRHCPYDYKNVPEPQSSKLSEARKNKHKN